MAVTVNQRPSQTTLTGGNTSKWNAAKNPLLYKFLRKDYDITAVANSGGALQITVNTNLTTLTAAQGGPVVAGSILWVQTDNGVYKSAYTVVSVTNVANSVVTFGASTYTAAATTGYINLAQRRYYTLEIEVYNGSDVLLSTLTFAPSSNGTINANISAIILNTLSIDNVHNYTTSTITSDDTSFTEFYIKYKETWIGHANSQTNDTANRFFALYGAKQIGETYGSNLAEYTCFENGTPAAKFLTKFDRPVLYRGYPFSISILTSDNQTTVSNVTGSYFDSTGFNISSFAPTKAVRNSKALRIRPVEALAIPSDASYLRVSYERTSLTLSELKFIDIKDPCANPILLYWRNSLGGDSFWMFEVSQEYSFRYDATRKARRYKLFADNLTLNQYEAINELNTLGTVYEPALIELTTSVNKSQARVGSQVYIMDATGNKTGVIVIPNETPTLTRKKRHKAQIIIELPEIY